MAGEAADGLDDLFQAYGLEAETVSAIRALDLTARVLVDLASQDVDELCTAVKASLGGRFKIKAAINAAKGKQNQAMQQPSAHGDDGDESHESQESWQDVDPDNMSYEELIALGEAVGTQSKGLTPNLIAALPHSTFSHAHTTAEDPCVICQFDYEDGNVLLMLPCKHCYHADCIKNWLEINKVCPICSAEVTS